MSSTWKHLSLIAVLTVLLSLHTVVCCWTGAWASAAETASTDEMDEWADEEDEWGDEDAEPVPSVADPIKPWNQAMFHINDKLYFWLLKPVARGYRYVVPMPVRRGVNHFFGNLTAPVRVVNSVLQGKPNRASIEVGRFFINVIEGGFGFIDAASHYTELDSSPEDFGQTLGHYGIGNAFYIVWPLLGPSTLRDTVGYAGDFFLDPLRYLDPLEARLGVRAFERVNAVSLRIGDYEALKEAALSPYEALKDAYIQNRHQLVRK
ncbi:MAG: VacJ family lipoprotein [Desulfobacterales bacterium]